MKKEKLIQQITEILCEIPDKEDFCAETCAKYQNWATKKLLSLGGSPKTKNLTKGRGKNN